MFCSLAIHKVGFFLASIFFPRNGATRVKSSIQVGMMTKSP